MFRQGEGGSVCSLDFENSPEDSATPPMIQYSIKSCHPKTGCVLQAISPGIDNEKENKCVNYI